jgi:hypothetical protein
MKTCLNHEEMVAVLENMLKYVDNQWKLSSTIDAINAVLDVYMGKTLPIALKEKIHTKTFLEFAKIVPSD